MKLLKLITVVGLLVLLALAAATWDLQRREAGAPEIKEAPAQPTAALLCPTCKGATYIEISGSESVCTVCAGTGRYSIMTGPSKGKTVSACPFCNGTGKVTKKIRKPCPTCHGTGFNPEARRNLSTPPTPATTQSAVLTCPTCKGAKTVPGLEQLCRNCGGRGTYKTRSAVAKLTTCPFCSGMGKTHGPDVTCPTCNGRGVVPRPPA